MQDLDEFTVTDEALRQMAGIENPRLKEICYAAVRHLHAFAREVNLTPEEWLQGIQFLTAVGQKCSPLRQEFILLSDVLGLSAVVNALHDRKARELGSQSSLLGPFYREGVAVMPMGTQIVENPTAEEIVVYGKVTDNDGSPLANALIQIWQTSERGLYDLQERNGEIDGYARQLPDRGGRQLLFPHRPPARLLDPDGWPGRRDGGEAEAPRHAAVAHPCPDRRRGSSRTGHGAVFRG